MEVNEALTGLKSKITNTLFACNRPCGYSVRHYSERQGFNPM